jgi:Type IIA topoisomerase (DNA gyrase/topo II, topoisomerase IV), A subunit
VRAEYERHHRDRGADQIIITELPYQENKARMVERIADDIKEGVIEGVSDLRDESDRNGVRVVLDLKRGANADVVENQLLESHLESTFGVINLALVDGQPQVLTLKETLAHYLAHRKRVVRRRSQHDLDEARDRAHILEGRLEAVDNAEAIVNVVTETADRTQAQAVLEGELDPQTIDDVDLEYPVIQSSLDFSAAQAEHILRMQIGSLTSMEAEDIRTEYQEVKERIDYLRSVLADEEMLLGVIEDELRDLESTYGDERQTSIVEAEGEVTHEDLIPEEDCLVVLTEEDYIKRMPAAAFDPQRRGGKGIIGADPKEGDRVSTVFMANTHDYLLCFTNQGQVYRVKTYEIPEMSRNARGKSAVNVIDLDDGEEITAVVDTDAFDGDECLTMVTREGYIKRTCAADFENIRSTGLIAATIDDDDALVDVEVTDRTGDLVVATDNGMTIRFAESEVREMGRNARGVRAIDLQDGDRVAGVVATNDADERALLTVTRNGYGKRTPLAEYRRQSRYGKGLVDIDTGRRNGSVATVKAITPSDDLIMMSERGQIMRTTVEEISTQGRNTMGVTVMNLEPGDRVTSVTVVPGGE